MSTHLLKEVHGVSEEAQKFMSLPQLDNAGLDSHLASVVDNSITGFHQFPDPSTMKGIDEAVELCFNAIKNKERILCVSDSDCDGMGTYLIFQLFFYWTGYQNIEYMIVKRSEGYGFIPKNITDRQIKPQLVITADNGITAHDACDYCNQHGIKTIITDHHQVNHKGVPPATVVIDPHQPGCNFAYPNINGTFVLWYFCWALSKKLMMQIDIFHMFLPELVLTTISDVMPLTGINRFIVKYGLGHFFKSDRMWVKLFMENKKELRAEDLAFGLIPSINVAGRLTDAVESAYFLCAMDYGTSKNWLNHLTILNNTRKSKQESLNKYIESNYQQWLEQPFILIPGQGEIFHKGILGPQAGRIAEKYNKPTIIMTLSSDGKTYSGSGRSVGTVDLLGIVKNSGHVDLNKTGGHKAACGVTLPAENLNAFWADLQKATGVLPREQFRPKINAIGKLAINEISVEKFHIIDKYEPYGEGFQKPAFCGEAKFTEVKKFGQLKNHLRGFLEDGIGAKVPFIWFFFNEDIPTNSRKRFMFTIGKDDFASEKSGQLEIVAQIKTLISEI